MAGYIFEKDNCIRLDEKWKYMLETNGLPYFRMSLCAHGNGVFKNLTLEERISVQTRAIELIKEYMAYGFVISIDTRFAHLIPTFGMYKNVYTFACWQALIGARRWMDKIRYSGNVAYFFESGHDSQTEANRIMQQIFTEPRLKKSYRYSSHTFADKVMVRPLQCADLLAWQWFTHQRRLSEGKLARADFYSLVEKPHDVFHYDEQKVKGLIPPIPLGS